MKEKSIQKASIIISVLALIISATSSFYTFFNPSNITHILPSTIYFHKNLHSKFSIHITSTFINSGAENKSDIIYKITGTLKNLDSDTEIGLFEASSMFDLVGSKKTSEISFSNLEPFSPIFIKGNSASVKTINHSMQSILPELSPGNYSYTFQGISAITKNITFIEIAKFNLTEKEIQTFAKLGETLAKKIK